ncbi:MAG: hypothetical protein EBV23_03725 [Flavobacteriia bacterium]|nr:hypothetical protein [Flavobacteriia bacterium]
MSIDSLPSAEFILKCKVVVKDVSYLDVQSKFAESRTEKMVFLIPQESTMRDFFFAKWLPDFGTDEKPEIAMVLPSPVNGFVRGCVLRRDARCEDHYIFIMTRAAEEDLKPLDGREIIAHVLHEDYEAVTDHTKNYEVPGMKKVDTESVFRTDANLTEM